MVECSWLTSTPIPLAEPDDQAYIPGPAGSSRLPARRDAATSRSSLADRGTWIARGLIVVLCSLHGLAIWWGLGGHAGLD